MTCQRSSDLPDESHWSGVSQAGTSESYGDGILSALLLKSLAFHDGRCQNPHGLSPSVLPFLSSAVSSVPTFLTGVWGSVQDGISSSPYFLIRPLLFCPGGLGWSLLGLDWPAWALCSFLSQPWWVSAPPVPHGSRTRRVSLEDKRGNPPPALGSSEHSQKLEQRELAHGRLADGLRAFISTTLLSGPGSQEVRSALQMLRKWVLTKAGSLLQVLGFLRYG